ncbi:Uncharacterised protein [Mycobacterium tuberculosis]|nr:Uncharacterised protein [Mycobacterium tuberculosis]
MEPNHQRLVGFVTQHAQRLDDPGRHRIARGDATEDVDEHALDLLVAQHHVQTRGHHLGRSAAADIQEVGRLDSAVLLTGIRDDVESRHHQARAIADDPHLTVQLDVVEVVLLGLQLQWIGGSSILELGMARLTEIGVAVEGDLGIQREDLVVRRPHQRVDLNQRRVLGDEELPQLGDGDRCGVEHLGRKMTLFGDGPREI